MLAYLMIGIYISASIVALLWPRKGLLLFWPLILCYPTWLLYGKLPMNAGLDDIFVVCLFIGSLMRSGGRLQIKWPVMAAILFCSLALLGDLSSIATGVSLSKAEVAKRFLKSTGLILMLFSASTVVTTPEQIKKLIYSFFVGASLGALLVIFYSIRPNAYNPFQIPAWALRKAFTEIQVIGPFSSHDRAGGVLGFSVLVVYFWVRFGRAIARKVIVATGTGIMLLGLLVSGSRSGWVFAGFPIMLSSLLSKKKITGLVLLGAVIILVVFALGKFEYFSERMEYTKKQWGLGDLTGRTSGRFLVWKDSLAQAHMRWLVFGDGFTIEETHPHNNYISILKNMGVVGIVFWVIYYWKIVSRSRLLMRYDSDDDMRALFAGVFWAYIGYFLFFFTATPVMWSPVRYTNFFLMCLVHLRYKQVQDEEHEYLLEAQSYQEPLDYEIAFEQPTTDCK